jgi:hypothetical protein
VDRPAGISATVLAQRAVRLRTGDALAPRELARWLLEQRLAVRRPDGLLAATPRGRELGAAFNPLEGA